MPARRFPCRTKPEPVEHCEVCRWSAECRAQWRAEDDLSLVANLTGVQRHALQAFGVTTRTGLAGAGESTSRPDRRRRPGGAGPHPCTSGDPGAWRARGQRDRGTHPTGEKPRGSARPEQWPADAPGTLARRSLLRYRGRPVLRLGRGRWNRLSLRRDRARTDWAGRPAGVSCLLVDRERYRHHGRRARCIRGVHRPW